MTAPARRAAVRALREIEDGRLDLPAALARSRTTLADPRDVALAHDIVTGTLRWQGLLDHVIARAASRPLAAVDPPVLTILRLSLYQLLYLDRVPASAVVDDAVDLVRAAKTASAAGFVNGILRATLRTRHRLGLPARPETGADREAVLDYLSITHSHPRWLVARWLDRHGFEAAEAWVRFNNTPPAITLRANGLRTTREDLAAALDRLDVQTSPTRFAPHGLTVTAGSPLRDADAGTFIVQDEASQLVALVVGTRDGHRVLDVCAAPGGKTTALAADVGPTGIVVACDARPTRVALLAETVRRAGADRAHVVRADATAGIPAGPVFDRVLVDVPCSGLGTLRRDPDIKWRRTADALTGFARAQAAMLAQALGALAPGGRLVYATCSSEPEENDDVVDRVLAGSPYRREPLDPTREPVLAPFIDVRGAFRSAPPTHALDAFYAAVITRA